MSSFHLQFFIVKLYLCKLQNVNYRNFLVNGVYELSDMFLLQQEIVKIIFLRESSENDFKIEVSVLTP